MRCLGGVELARCARRPRRGALPLRSDRRARERRRPCTVRVRVRRAVHGVRRCERSTATRLTCERRVRRERSGARGRSRRVGGGGHACSPRARSMSVDLSRRWRSLRVHTSVPPVHEDVVDERTCQGTGSPEWVKRDDSYRPSGRARQRIHRKRPVPAQMLSAPRRRCGGRKWSGRRAE